MLRSIRTDDVEELCARLEDWDLHLRPLDHGSPQAEVLQLAEPGYTLLDLNLGRACEQRGTAPTGMRTFGLLTAGRGLFFDREGGHDTIQVFPANNAFEAICKGPFRALVVSVREEAWAEAAELLERPQLCDQGPGGVQHLDPLRVSEAARGLRWLRGASMRNPAGPACDAVELAGLLARALASSDAPYSPPPCSVRAQVWQRARAVIEARSREALSVRELCRFTGASWRTLDYAFQEHAGVTPKRYMQTLRLDGVRRALKQAESKTRIADVANAWGFWHLGQFAADYRKLYGERPSDTRRRT